jgi:hypothetical protein
LAASWQFDECDPRILADMIIREYREHGLEAAQACIADSAKAYGKAVVLAAYSLMWRGRLQEDGVEIIDTSGDPHTFRVQRRGEAWVVVDATDGLVAHGFESERRAQTFIRLLTCWRWL